MRNLDKATKLREEVAAANVESKVRFLSLDVVDANSINAAVKKIIEDDGRIDVLVNNAGYSVFGGVEMVSNEVMREQFDTNFFGAVMCMKAVLPHMRAQRSGKIINISSIGGVWGQPFNDIYCASKFALEGFSESMASVYSQFGVYVTCVEPGAIKSDFSANSKRPENIPDELKPLVGKVVDYYTKAFKEQSSRAQTPDEVAAVILATAENPKPNFRVITNPHYIPLFSTQLVDITGNAGPALATSRFFPS